MTQIRTLKLYNPTAAQLKIHQSPFRNNVICFGRQSGKSTYGNNKLFDKCWTTPSGIFWYVGPTYRLAEQMHDRALFSLKNSGALKDKSLSDLMIQLKSDGRIFYKSGEKPENLLGETLHGVVVDEAAKQKKEIWTRYIKPMLGTTRGWADFLSTPDGFDWFYDLYQYHLTKKNWGAFHAPSGSNPLWTPEELEEAKSEMSEDLYAQEILAEFRDLGSGSCYISFSSTTNIRDSSPFAAVGEIISPYLPILVGMDFNLNPMSWVLGQTKNKEIYWHDEQVIGRTHTAEAAKILVEKVKNHEAGVIICGDASGKAGQRAAQAGQSDYDVIKNIFRQAGIRFQDKTPDSNPPIKDRVNTVNSSFKSADGSIHQWFHPRCRETIKDVQRRKWKEGAASLAFDNADPTSGHCSDAIGYATCVFSPIKPIGNVGRVRIIQRTL